MYNLENLVELLSIVVPSVGSHNLLLRIYEVDYQPSPATNWKHDLVNHSNNQIKSGLRRKEFMNI